MARSTALDLDWNSRTRSVPTSHCTDTRSGTSRSCSRAACCSVAARSCSGVGSRTKLGGGWASAYAAVSVLLGSSLTYYSTYMPSYSHAMHAFACAAFLYYWARTLG